TAYICACTWHCGTHNLDMNKSTLIELQSRYKCYSQISILRYNFDSLIIEIVPLVWAMNLPTSSRLTSCLDIFRHRAIHSFSCIRLNLVLISIWIHFLTEV